MPHEAIHLPHDDTLKRLLNKHHRALELALDGVGTAEIGEQLGFSKSTVSRILTSPAAQSELARRRAERAQRQDEAAFIHSANARIELDSAAGKAAQTQVGLLNSEDERIKQKAAMDILDRTGHARVEVRENLGASIVLDASALKRLLEANRACFPDEPIIIVQEDSECQTSPQT